MTKIVFYKKECNLTAFEISGHTNFDEHGKDILCSSISTASQMIVWGVVNELKLDANIIKKDGFLSFRLNEKDITNSNVQTLMKTGLGALENIVSKQKKYVKLEVKNDI